ncbi:MAG: FtsX-like permease family protein [Spirochaetales bacterium]|nr:FtsX-like permease family protein [Spirochaetales bacterium]
MLVFKIAWRNIQRHKGKSFVIAVILFMGALIMTAGNAVTIGMERGIEENLVKRMTGNILIASDDEPREDVLFTPMGKPIKLLKDYDKIREALKKQDYIQDFLPMTRGGAALVEAASPSAFLVFGVNFDDYQRVFGNNLEAIEGKLLTNGDHGLLVQNLSRERIYKSLGFWIVPEGEKLNPANLIPEAKTAEESLEQRSNLVLMGFGTENASNLRIPVKGVYRAKTFNQLWDGFGFLDIESFRECFGYYKARDVVVELPAKEKALIESNESDFFGESDLFVTGDTDLKTAEIEKKLKTVTTRVERKIDYDNSAYNLIAVKLKPGVSPGWAMGQINRLIKDEGLPAKAVTWRQAVGTIAQFISILEVVLFVFVVILFIIAAIIIMNTLAMAAMERTEELGMMRAVGAHRSFIGLMFLGETFMLSFMGGGLGILVGVIASWILRAIKISSGTSDFASLFFGGDTFQPTLGFAGLVGCIGLLAAVTVVSVIYPIFVARRITPLDAINRN